MKRRESLKALLIGSIGATGLAVGVNSCKTEGEATEVKVSKGYGRIASEKLHDERIAQMGQFFSDAELSQIAVLCDLILPATETAGSATDAKVPEFIDFIVKDLPYHQLPIQGGLMWLNGESNKRFQKPFVDITETEQKEILDDIAYITKEEVDPYKVGRKFFNQFRNLVLSGYYTTKIGIDALGYVGNRPNQWDGVPDDVLAAHGLAYDKEMEGRYINHDTSNTQATWDEKGNILS